MCKFEKHRCEKSWTRNIYNYYITKIEQKVNEIYATDPKNSSN